jgi:hypothetical protein
MQRTLNASIKFDLQQNYRRYLRFLDQYGADSDKLKLARASKVWVAALIMLLFALASDFFLGASAALFGLYFYRIGVAYIEVTKVQEGREQSERWFASQGLKFEGRVLYFKDDLKLDNPLDPFNDSLYR